VALTTAHTDAYTKHKANEHSESMS